MKELTRVETSKVVGGNWENRWYNQDALCQANGGYGSGNRHCRRADRIWNRHN